MSEEGRKALYADMKGYLIAWDPVRQEARWRVDEVAPFNGGVLATGGGLVFAGNTARELVAYDEATGRKLWSFDAQTGIMAPPITYAIDGVQYIAVMAGWGGGWPLTGGVMALQAGRSIGPNRLLMFRLEGTARLPPFTPPDVPRQSIVTSMPADTAAIARGDLLYGRFCLRCHGSGAVSAGPYPDLRVSRIVMDEAFHRIVLDGALAAQGMPGFTGQMTRDEVDDVRAYLARRSYEDFGKGESLE